MKLETLIIDDDEIVILIQKRMISISAFHSSPLSFSNGKEGLDYILNNNDKDTLYFILLDINMPVMDGWQFLDAVNTSPVLSQLTVAVVTSSTNETDRLKAFQYKQVITYIEKPVTKQKLIELKQHEELKHFFI